MEKIKCTIERITFQNPENGRIVTNAPKPPYQSAQAGLPKQPYSKNFVKALTQ